MAANQLSDYLSQLEQINSLLEQDPENTDLLELQKDLQQLTSLLTQDSNQTTSAVVVAPEPDAFGWKIGDSCQVKDAKLGWLSGEIASISADRTKFSIKTKTERTERIVFAAPNQIQRPTNEGQIKYYGFSAEPSSKKRRREKQVQKKAEFNAKKEVEQSQKTQTWQSFQTRISKSNAPNATFFTAPHKSVYKKPENNK